MDRDRAATGGCLRSFGPHWHGSCPGWILRVRPAAATDHVSLAGKTWKGPRLGYQFIAFNPLNPKRYVVVTGMNAWAALPEWKLHPSRHGLCDYFIYDLSSPTPRLIDAGYFPAQVWK